MNIGIMKCPNCGRIRGTDNNRCICGYNPLTEKVEDIYPKFNKNDEPLKIPEIQVLPKAGDENQNLNDWNQHFEEFCIKANVNWLQYKLIKEIKVFDWTAKECETIFYDIKLGMTNDIYNGVPRLSQGNKIIDLAASIKGKFLRITEKLPTWKKHMIHYILLGDYDVAYLMFDKL